MSVGENIRKRREKLGMMQAQLADKVGVTQSMICQMERGTKVPTLPLSMEIAAALQCDIQKLAGDL